MVMITVGQERVILRSKQVAGGVEEEIIAKGNIKSCFFELNTQAGVKFAEGNKDAGRIRPKEYFQESETIKRLLG